MERHYGGCLCYGPPIDGGYYYDSYLDDHQVTPKEFDQLGTLFKSITAEKQPFVRLEMKKEDLLEMFKVCSCLCPYFSGSFLIYFSTTSSSAESSMRK